MKKNKAKIQRDEVEVVVLKYILNYLNWKGAFMLFPYKNSKGENVKARIDIKIKWNVK